TSLIPISSTQIRQAIALPEYAGEGLAPQVWEKLKEWMGNNPDKQTHEIQ
ncbi:MAG: hypothetical protein HUK03_06180, partial [Bacteroidaceae bacterium]|nr:hypothetical protein [Bacteroidaceae bacterium]